MDQSIKPMDLLTACLIAEGTQEASDDDVQRAWQYLYDQRADRFLQGTYGRTMAGMLADGYIVDHGGEVG